MIAVSSSGRTFRALAAYLARGRDGDSPERVLWSAGRNLPTDDPELAATMMRATAAQSVKVEKPVYHLVLSFDPADPVTRAEIERVADQVLRRLGLHEHQAVIVAHGDRAHPHVHLFVNRVHPEMGRAWERWQDRPIIQQVLREEEIALGLRRVMSSLEPPATRVTEPARVPTTQIEPESRPQPGMQGIRPRAEEVGDIRRDLEADLDLYGRIRSATAERLHAERDMEAVGVRVQHLTRSAERGASAIDRLERSVEAVYRDPRVAIDRLLEHADREGISAAVETLREHPERFGSLQTVERPRLLGMGRSRDDSPAREAAVRAAPAAAELLTARAEIERLIGARSPAREVRVTSEPSPGTITPDRGAGVDAYLARLERLRAERDTARQALASLTGRYAELRNELRTLPRGPGLERRIAQTLGGLAPHELREVTRLLSAPRLALLSYVRRAAQEVLLGRDEERHA